MAAEDSTISGGSGVKAVVVVVCHRRTREIGYSGDERERQR